jgi:hypothetical protein
MRRDIRARNYRTMRRSHIAAEDVADWRVSATSLSLLTLIFTAVSLPAKSGHRHCRTRVVMIPVTASDVVRRVRGVSVARSV